ncbi:MAG: DNA gyrase subunit A, partial [Clostridia bacterium]|nr:DNA gyrase subunit A [Clostridia bacterium]
IGMTTKEEDFVESVLVANSHEYLMFFTNLGKVYTKKTYRIPEASRTAKGTNIVNVLEKLAEDEKITAIIPIAGFADDEYLTMITKRGVIKRTRLSEYEYQRKGGKRALTLDEGDELLFIRHTRGEGDLLLATRSGLATRFNEETVRVMGRTARGVRGISLREDDEVVGVALVEEGKKLLTITENGFGKRCDFDDFRAMKNRGGHGVGCHNVNEKTGALSSIAAVSEEDDIMLITSAGVIIRTPVSGIPTYSRTAGGVIVMRLDEGVKVVTFTRLEREEETLREIAAAPADEEAPAVSATLPTAERETPDGETEDGV